MPVETIAWKNGACRIIDQTRLPEKLKYLRIRTIEDMWDAIRRLSVRGAPAIGIAAAYGLYLGVRKSDASDFSRFEKEINKASKYLASSRPTAVNLKWALERMKRVARDNSGMPVRKLKRRLLQEAHMILAEDIRDSRKMGDYGMKLIPDNASILTHCNAGGLATGGYGTALAVIYRAAEEGKNLQVYADETRPLLQGGRLTSWELARSGIDVTVICDNMAGYLMSQGRVDAVLVGADRITTSGDFANKIGTYGLAVLAKAHKIPFYVAAPCSTFDPELSAGEEIPIEQRPPEEIRRIGNKKIVPDHVFVYNPAFDVTPHKYVTAFITEDGIVERPFKTNIKKLLQDKENNHNG